MLPVRFPRCLHLEKTQYEQSSPVFAFTLIELLIVIAIILIVIAIAMPNFLEAQVRAQVIRVKGDLHGLSTAMEQYYQDFKVYPAMHDNSDRVFDWSHTGLYRLTTPIKYYSSNLSDPFRDRYTSTFHLNGIIKHDPVKAFNSGTVTWYLRSCAPDKDCYPISPSEPMSWGLNSYCPTNGTISEGDIVRWGGDPFWVGIRLLYADIGDYHRHIEGGGSIERGFYLDGVTYLHQFPPSFR